MSKTNERKGNLIYRQISLKRVKVIVVVVGEIVGRWARWTPQATHLGGIIVAPKEAGNVVVVIIIIDRAQHRRKGLLDGTLRLQLVHRRSHLVLGTLGRQQVVQVQIDIAYLRPRRAHLRLWFTTVNQVHCVALFVATVPTTASSAAVHRLRL